MIERDLLALNQRRIDERSRAQRGVPDRGPLRLVMSQRLRGLVWSATPRTPDEQSVAAIPERVAIVRPPGATN